MPETLRALTVAILVVLSDLLSTAHAAEASEAFYKGKQIDLYTSAAAGGNSNFARPLAQYLRQHLPGQPNIVLKEMLGAGGLTLANFMDKVASKDGLVLASVNRGILVDPLLKTQGALFDASKFSMLGNLAPELAVCAVSSQSASDTIKKAQEKEVVLGSVGPTTITTTYPHLLNATIHTKFKVITGYQTTQEIMLAVERGEVEGACLSYGTLKANRPDWIPGKKVKIIVQFAFKAHPELKDVPTLSTLVNDAKARSMVEFYTLPDEVARPYFAPPGIPADRLNVLRKAFDETMQDAEFIKEQQQLKLDLDPMSGEEAQRKLQTLYSIPPATIQEVIDALAKEREMMSTPKK
jgi:tripartite-type tricarboxylate transporter receptor subunit TctC